jgi:hypothetical protein
VEKLQELGIAGKKKLTRSFAGLAQCFFTNGLHWMANYATHNKSNKLKNAQDELIRDWNGSDKVPERPSYKNLAETK